MQTNFEKVSLLNQMIGNPVGNLSQPDWDALQAQLEIVRQEFEEMEEAIQKRDTELLRDATGDVLVTTYGMAHRAGIQANQDMDLIQESNISKFCHSEQEALDTAKKYEKIQVKVIYRHLNEFNVIAVVSREDQIGTDGKHYPYGKLLKSVNFKEPQFT